MNRIINLTTAAYFLLAIGILISVSILGAHQILLFLPVLFYLYKELKNKEIKISKSSIFLFLFMIACLISLIVNFSDLRNPSKSFGKIKYLFIALGSIPVLNYWLPNVKPAHLKFLIHSFFASIIAAGSYAIYQAITSGGARTDGFIGIMRYGYASAMITILLLSTLLNRKNLKFEFNIVMGWTAFVFGLVGIFLTQTRGALAGFLTALPFVLYFFRPRLGLAVGAVSFLIISVLGYAYLFGTGDYKSRYLKPRTEMGDVVRQEQWQSAIIATKEHPLFGWGYNNFYSQVERIKKENNLKTTFYVNEHSHNTFLEIAAGTGLIGFFFFMGWLVLWAIECFKLEKALRGIFVSFGVCFVISGQFEVLLDTNNTVLLFFIYSLSQYAVIQDD